MKLHQIMQVNALILLIVGLISYLSSSALTALIAPFFGVLILFFSFRVADGNSKALTIVIVLTALISLALLMPIIRAQSTEAVIMFVVSIICLIYYIFVTIKKKK